MSERDEQDEPELLADVVPIFAIPALTDAEWAAKAASVLAEQQREQRVSLRPVDLTKRGWPVRAVEAAKAADTYRDAISRVLAWDSGSRSIAVIAGVAGCGKTVAAAHWAMHRCPGAVFLRAATFAASSRYNAEARDRWYSAPALCLDDLGAEYLDAKGSFLVDLDELIDTYYGDQRPLVITTNTDGPAFRSRYGERIADRLRECAVWLSVTDASQRRRT